MKLLFCRHLPTPNQPPRYFPSGIYTLAESCRFCRYWDTLVIIHDRSGYANVYRIARKTAFQFIQDAPLEPWRMPLSRWPAIYDPPQLQMIPYGHGSTLLFLPDQNALTLKGEKYLRLE